jgi:ferritin-like metal-binding protein YciE
MAEVSIRDAKLIQYLNEAYGKERELETALQAHITMTSRAPYKKRLQEHLRETKDHARRVNRRIKELGGKAEAIPAVPDRAPNAVGEAAAAVTTAASRAIAAAKGPLHAIRGTSDAEKMLKNAKTEYFNEFEEIATYRAIETLAETVGDRDTQRLARDIRRQEERMASFLERQIPTLTRAVAQAEIPASERRARGGGRKRRSASRSASRSTARKRSTSRSRSRGSSSGSKTKSKSSGRSKSRSGSGGRRKRS